MPQIAWPWKFNKAPYVKWHILCLLLIGPRKAFKHFTLLNQSPSQWLVLEKFLSGSQAIMKICFHESKVGQLATSLIILPCDLKGQIVLIVKLTAK